MSSRTREYKIRLSAQGARELEAHLKRTGKGGAAGLEMIDKSARRASKGLGLLGSQIPAVRGLAQVLGATAITTGVVRIGTSALRAAKDFQAAMKRVQGALRATDAQMAQLEEKARAAGATTSFRASEAASAIEMLAKNGLSYQQIMDGALDATLAMAGALGAELSPAADLATDLMLQFGLRSKDLVRVSDLVVGAALKSKFGFDDLRLAIGQAGGVAGSFGVEIEDFLTALAATSSAFSSGQDAGTSFKNFLQRLTPQSKQAKAAMEQLDLVFFDANGNMKSLVEIAEELSEGVEGLSEQARNEALVKIFGTDAVRSAILLAQQGADGIREIGAAINEASAADQAAIRLSGLEGALKELASAWEALQLTWSDQGGLDVAEDAVRRLTDVVRYLNENFDEVNETVERVVQALTVILVGRGVNIAIARGIAMHAAYIDMAQAVTTAGAASVGAAANISRLAIAGRVALATLGGPAGLLLTAGALLSLVVDIDRTQDALDGARTAADNSLDVLSAYRDAVGEAEKAQNSFGGEVDKTTQKLLSQNRVKMQDSIRELREARAKLLKDMVGDDGLIDADEVALARDTLRNALARDQEGNKYLEEGLGVLGRLRDGSIELEHARDFLDQIAGIGDEAQGLVNALDRAMAGSGQGVDEATQALVNYARQVGGFGEELRAFDGARGPAERTRAVIALRDSMIKASKAGEALRGETGAALREIVTTAADTETKLMALEAALKGNWEEAQRLLEADNPFKVIEDGARDAAEEVATLSAKMSGLTSGDVSAYREYYQSRIAGYRPTAELSKVADKGLRALVRRVEGTDGPRGYNTTLDYGRWTGGPRNLTGMSLDEILALQSEMLANPENRAKYSGPDGTKGSSALGAYQITRRTLKSLMSDLNLDGSDLFDEKMQDRLFRELVRRRDGQGAAGLKSEWQGLQRVPDWMIQHSRAVEPVPSRDATLQAEADEASKRRAKDMERERELIDRLLLSGKERADHLEFERTLEGKSAQEKARLRYIYQALAEAKRAGIDVDKAYVASGRTLRAEIEAQAELVAKRTADQVGSVDEVMRARDAVESAFERLRKAPSSIGDAFGDMVDYISSRLWSLAMDPIFDTIAESIAGMFTPSGGGILSLFGLRTGGSVDQAPDLPKFRSGGLQVGGRASGKIRGAGSKEGDNILLLGSRDEYMMRAKAVDYYGVEFMEKLNKMELPKFANGGAMRASAASGGLMAGRYGPMQIHLAVEASEDLRIVAAKAGGEQAGEVAVKVVEASNKRLTRTLRSKQFREDL